MEFDLEQLSAITGGDPDFEREVLEEYLACTPADMEHIRASIAAADAAELGRCAHALKGSSATIGAAALAALARELELLGKAGDCSNAPAIYGRLVDQYESACAFIRERLAKAA